MGSERVVKAIGIGFGVYDIHSIKSRLGNYAAANQKPMRPKTRMPASAIKPLRRPLAKNGAMAAITRITIPIPDEIR
jgi:hypothetical protein